MSLRRVPGARHYKAESDGFKAINNSAGMATATLAVAQRIAEGAEDVGRGTYTASNLPIRMGSANEQRAGAVVSAGADNDWRDTRDRVLVRVTEAMAVRGRR